MKIKWFGHAAFGLTSESGVTVITDPYEPGGYNGAIRYSPISHRADIITVSHQHSDHNHTKNISDASAGSQKPPIIIDRPGHQETSGIKITGIPAYHDDNRGKDRGNNIIFICELDGLRIAHCGDLGHILVQPESEALGVIDVLLIPVGGNFTIDGRQTIRVITDINPKIAIPMHYKTEALDFPIAGIEDFISRHKNVKTIPTPEISVSKTNLPVSTEIWILPYH